MLKTILGLDLRVCAVKVVELRYGKEKSKVINWGMSEVPYELVDKHPEKEIAQAEALQKILAENRIRTKEAVLVLGGGDVLVKDYSMPIRSRGEAREAIRWKIRDEIGYPIEDAVIDFVALGPSSVEGETLFIASAAHKDTISRGLEIAREAGLKVVGAVPVPVALEHVFASELLKDAVVSMIYMGKRTTNMSFFKEGNLQFNREVPIGGEDITEAMTSILVSDAGKLELSHDQAEKIKRQYGIVTEEETQKVDIPMAQLMAVMRPALERIEDEILRTIEYYRGQIGDVPIQKIILTGGSAKTPHLPEFLSRGVGVEFEVTDPLKGLEVKEKIANKEALLVVAPQLSSALGVALSAFSEKPTVNLLPDEVKEKWKTLLRRHLNIREISIAYALILVLMYGYLLAQIFFTTARISDIKMRNDALRPKVTRLEEIERVVREEEGRRGIFKSIELTRIQIPEALEDISLSVTPSILLSEIKIVEAAREVRIKGMVFSKGGAAENILSKFMSNLAKSEGFAKVELVQAVKNGNYRYEAFDFELVGIVKKRER